MYFEPASTPISFEESERQERLNDLLPSMSKRGLIVLALIVLGIFIASAVSAQPPCCNPQSASPHWRYYGDCEGDYRINGTKGGTYRLKVYAGYSINRDRNNNNAWIWAPNNIESNLEFDGWKYGNHGWSRITKQTLKWDVPYIDSSGSSIRIKTKSFKKVCRSWND